MLRMAAKERGLARKRSRRGERPVLTPEPVWQGQRRKIDLHVLLLPSSSSETSFVDDTQDDVLEGLDGAGVKVHLHPLIAPPKRTSLFASSPAKNALVQAFAPDGPYASLVCEEIAAAGFVFGSQPCEENDAAKYFVELLSKHSSSAFPMTNVPPTVSFYVPPRPGSSDFDLDLDDILSLRVLNSAAAEFRTHAPPTLAPAPLRRSTSRRSWQDESSTPKSFGGHLRRVSTNSLPSFLSPSPSPTRSSSASSSSTSLKSLVLRPAPGPVQSVSLRLDLDAASGVFLRVCEALTPVTPQGHRVSFDYLGEQENTPSPPPRSPTPRTPRSSSASSSPSPSPLRSASPAPPRPPRAHKRQETMLTTDRFQAGTHVELAPLKRRASLKRNETMSTPRGELEKNPQLNAAMRLLQGRQQGNGVEEEEEEA